MLLLINRILFQLATGLGLMAYAIDGLAQTADAATQQNYNSGVLAGVALPLIFFLAYRWFKDRKPIYVGVVAYSVLEIGRMRYLLNAALPFPREPSGHAVMPLAGLIVSYIIVMWLVPRIAGASRHRPSIARFASMNSAVLFALLILLLWNGPASWVSDLITGWCAVNGVIVALFGAWQTTQVEPDQRIGTFAIFVGYGFTSILLGLAASGLRTAFELGDPLWLAAQLTRLLLMVGAVFALEFARDRPGPAALVTANATKSTAPPVQMMQADNAGDLSAQIQGVDPHSREIERRLTESLTEMNNSLDMHKQMNSLMSHEMRVPVSTISAAAQSLEMILTGSGDIVDSRLARIRRSISRITELLDQFFNQDRLKESSFAPRQEQIDLARLARDVVANLQPDAAHNLIVEAPEPVLAWCDRPLCGVVLRNLLYNAIKYSPANQPIYVRVFFLEDAHKNSLPAISVIDNGPGIGEQELEQIFDPHYRRPSHREIKGMGIGLYLARRICQNQHGSLTVCSEPGHGACFTITLPAPEKQTS